MANLSLKHIYKVYPNGTKAVSDFNMEIADKEFIVFVGPSGCGKSTTLRMIAGLEDISAGELKIGDLVVNDVEPKDRDIAMVFQNYALYPHMTVYENIAFGLRLRKLPKDEIHQKVVEAAEILGITEYLGKKPKEMSGGQRQRVALGRAIVREPKVMLLDEPLSNLDAKLRTQMRTEISKLHTKLKTTFIYVTHDQVEAMTMGTRIVVMKDGFVQQIDTPKNLYNYPTNKFVAGFIGTPQMNFFVGTLKKSGDDIMLKIECSDARIKLPSTMLNKVKPAYLDGKSQVYIGLRAEDLSVASTGGKSPDASQSNNAVLKVRVTRKEELGSETLIYGDIKLDEADGGNDGYTKIIIKDSGEKQFEEGEVIEVALNLAHIHLFDYETEASVLPRLPEFNYLDCTVNNGKLTFCGEEIALPSAINCGKVKGELLIPIDAIKLGGNIKAEVVSCEEINGEYLLELTVGGKRLYALSPEQRKSGGIQIGIDFKKITIISDGNEAVKPMPALNSLDCKFVKEKVVQSVEVNGKTRKKKTVRFSFDVCGAQFEAADNMAQKIFVALGIKKAFTAKLRLESGIYGFKISDTGIAATATETLDYGDEKFLKCDVGGATVYVATDKQINGELHLVPDFDQVGIVDAEREIRII